MTNKEKTALLQKGRERCLDILERLFVEEIQSADPDRAKTWYYEYSGAVQMLEALDLLSGEESGSLRDAHWSRFMTAKFPDVAKEEAV